VGAGWLVRTEIFSLANEHAVDMVLLTGNLFHDNKPSRKALQSAIEVLRTHCLDHRDIGIEILSEQGSGGGGGSFSGGVGG
jgi:double-strand break repair protein MRE11